MNRFAAIGMVIFATAAGAGEITIDPAKTVCYPFKGLSRSGWHLVGEHDRDRIAELAGAGKVRFIEHGQTLRCKYIDRGRIKADFYLNQQWWK